ncbi:hypothetical protein ABGF49_04400 [Helcococcus ovis]|uniref:Twitching motility protein PilT n=1 Tax=Helcococcus ovis TaxID=72026 RepID=A0A4R9C3R7_9FIRM|nr:hypothetical protein [Helcococcus ovis]TFF64267.1 hypothetical protein EQF92_06325 [Helcococcus ovis]TFF66430.1 hypothetical protein EQF91_03775 [Helcococcus ovis]TFF67382.1 hypothetical protein EQF93_05485 [Helcococcus ovis]WNZ01873.1 hypothetical protein EQF90_003285 [Helcococcus ovis]
MVKLVLGKSGSGKTKYLIDNANEEKSRGNGNIVFIDTDDSHIFSLDYAVRLINAKKYGIDNIESLYGFIAGIVSRDYDIEKVYLDGLYQIVEFTPENTKVFVEKLNKLTEESDLEILLGLDFEDESEFKDLEVEVQVL